MLYTLLLLFTHLFSPELKLFSSPLLHLGSLLYSHIPHTFIPFCISVFSLFSYFKRFCYSCFSIQIDIRDTRSTRHYKNFQIEVASDGYRLYGTETLRPTLRELLEHLEGQSLRADNLQFQLLRCCPPQPRGKLNAAIDIENDGGGYLLKVTCGNSSNSSINK